MKSRDGIIFGCFALGLCLVGTGWYALRVEMGARDRVSHAILARLDQDSLLLSQKIAATTRALGGLRADLGRMLEQLSARLTDPSQLVANEESREPLSLAEEDFDQAEDTENLPPLPKEVVPRFLLSSFRKEGKVGRIILNPQLNPRGMKRVQVFLRRSFGWRNIHRDDDLRRIAFGGAERVRLTVS